MLTEKITPEQASLYREQGYIIIENFCSAIEIDKLYQTAINDNAMRNNALDLNDQTGKKTRLSLWFTPGNDVFGYLTRSRRMVSVVEQLLGDSAPVCHFHSKLM